LHQSALSQVRADVDRYYSDRLGRYGATPLGVGWTCVPTQELRFVQLARLFDSRGSFSLNDVGCGYGALLAYLRKRHKGAAIDYLGLDISHPMVEAARRRWKTASNVQFALPGDGYRRADYCVASGVFNVKLGHDRGAWEEFVSATLAEMYAASRLGMAVNFLLEDQALDEVQEHYRCLPTRWVEHCGAWGASAEVRQNYGMAEFTLLLRRQ
jgi:hypothetical protein